MSYITTLYDVINTMSYDIADSFGIAQKKRKTVTFSPDFKQHDGLRPATLLYYNVILECFKIGGFRTSEQLIAFLAEISPDFYAYFNDIISMIVDLKMRLIETCGTVLILNSGRKGYDTVCDFSALRNIEHVEIVFKCTRRDYPDLMLLLNVENKK